MELFDPKVSQNNKAAKSISVMLSDLNTTEKKRVINVDRFFSNHLDAHGQ